MNGYEEALDSLGLERKEEWICEGDYMFASGVAAGEKLLGLDDRPTAIIASNDDMAAGVMATAHRLNYEVPGQLSVVGFDDIPMAERLWPPLTTIRQPIKSASATAAEVLLALLDDADNVSQSTELEAELVIRESTGPVRL